VFCLVKGGAVTDARKELSPKQQKQLSELESKRPGVIDNFFTSKNDLKSEYQKEYKDK
jgi:hypothetical protein